VTLHSFLVLVSSLSEYWVQQKSCCRCVQPQDVLLTPSFLPATFIHTSDLALSTNSGSVFPKVARDGHALYLAVPARTRPSYPQLRALVAHVRCPGNEIAIFRRNRDPAILEKHRCTHKNVKLASPIPATDHRTYTAWCSTPRNRHDRTHIGR